MKKLLLTLAVLASAASACGIATGDIQATVSAQVASTVAAQTPKEVQVTVEVPVEVPATVEVPVEVQVTVQVPITVVVEATPVAGAADTPPAPAATNPPVVSTNAQDPLAGANPAPVIDEKFDFPDRYFWYLFDTSTGEGKIENETFILIAKEPERLEWTFDGKKFGNAYVTAKTLVPNTTCKAGDNWGLIFRHKDNANFYLFGVSCDGKYRLLKRVDGVFETIVDFTDSDAIKDLGQRNVLGVRAAGGQISMYVNDQFLGTVADGTFAEGVIGMYVGSRLTPNLTVSFDDIAVYTIGQ
ncbi:MAG: hypothetical protein HYZ49_08465 [Chloroflexi bacterium]|nr:hypothetical protein [Chloroflexota bacterium]